MPPLAERKAEQIKARVDNLRAVDTARRRTSVFE
jgi:hypothetical protein